MEDLVNATDTNMVSAPTVTRMEKEPLVLNVKVKKYRK